MPRSIFRPVTMPMPDPREDLPGIGFNRDEDEREPVVIPVGPVAIVLPSTVGDLIIGGIRTLLPGSFSGRPPPVITVQWQKDNGLGVFLDISGATGLSLPGLTLGTYRAAVTATNIFGSITVTTASFLVVAIG